MKRVKEWIFLIVLVVVLLAVNYNHLNGFVVNNFGDLEQVKVDRVVDGDTVVVNGIYVRLLGINTPESGEKGYYEAKEFLSSRVINRTIYIERHGKDLYNRDLAYLFSDSRDNINLEIVTNGYGNYYFPEGKSKYYDEFVSGWQECVDLERNLCKRSFSECSACIDLEELNYKDDYATFVNTCSYSCSLEGWDVKDEGRKHYTFGDVSLDEGEMIVVGRQDFGKDYVWTNTGDTLFLRDEFGNLVLWEGY